MTEYIRMYGEENPSCGQCGGSIRPPDQFNELEPWEGYCHLCGTVGTFQDEAGDPDFMEESEDCDGPYSMELNFD